jgi:hypothetical protein
MIPATSGILSAIIIESNPCLKRWVVPKVVTKIFQFYVGQSTSRSQSSIVLDQQPEQRDVEEYVPREEDILLLEGMGFERQKVYHALTYNRGNVQGAIAYILSTNE